MNTSTLSLSIIAVILGIIIYYNLPKPNIDNPTYIMATKPLKAFVLGGTGTAGKSIVKALIDHPDFETVTVIGRSKLELPSVAENPGFAKIDQKIIDFEDAAKYAKDFEGYDVGFCALGTAIVGVTNEQYYRINHDYVVETAKLALAGGCKHFHFVSGRQASKDSFFFWARTKGEVEEKLSQMGFERVSIYRPAGIIKDTTEIGTKMEHAGIFAWKILDPFRLASVETLTLGKVIVNNTFRVAEPIEILDNPDINKLGKELK